MAENKLLVFGGAIDSKDQSFVTTNDTFLVNCDTLTWTRLENINGVPCQRAAHSTVAVEPMEIMMFGGALVGGSIAKEQLYHMQIKESTLQASWSEVKTGPEKPKARYGHSLVFARPTLVLFGGSTGTETLNDVWLLNLTAKAFAWERVAFSAPPYPSPRVYHSADICTQGGAAGMIIVYGGRDAENRTLNEVWGLRRHRSGKWDWVTPPVNQSSEVAPMGRYQHRSLFYGTLMFNVGGKISDGFCNALVSVYDYEYNKWYAVSGPECFRHICWVYKGKLFVQGGLNSSNKIYNNGEIIAFGLWELFREYPDLSAKIKSYIQNPQMVSSGLPPSNSSSRSTSPTSDVPRASQAEAPRPSANFPGPAQPPRAPQGDEIRVILPKSQPQGKRSANIADIFINQLLRPKTYLNLAPDADFNFTSDQIIELTNQALAIVEKQPTLINVESPAKVFGDIHGQYSDLMRFFDLWGAPCNPEEENQTSDNYSYVFLGDYVDRGNHSLETICLLMALKIKFPDTVHLLRGNHEDLWINRSFGFYDECERRMQETPDLPDSIFSRINAFFEYLPLASVIDDKILCIHGGIGSTLKTIDQIRQIQRPLEVVHEVSTPLEKLVVDILWSDPTDNDGELGIQPNVVRDPHGSGNIVKFGPDVVKQFLHNNKLSKIIRAHECVMDGFERFAGGDLITVFSATDYCGKHKNAAAILVITRNYSIHANLIYPSFQQANWIEDGESGFRAPTPPRWHNPPQNYS